MHLNPLSKFWGEALFALFFDNVPAYYVFPFIVTASLIASVVGSLVTHPVDRNILVSFYCSVRPFGFWKPIRKESGLSSKDLASKSENTALTLLNVFLGMLAIVGFYLFPMYLVGHWYAHSITWLGVGLAAVIALKYTWYQNLPQSRPTGD